jgi:hypothetical protein
MAIDLSQLRRGKRLRAPKIVVYGPAKIGKSTWAASAPNSVGILTEEGADAIDCTTFPLATSLDAVYEAIGALMHEPHEFESVFLDSLDWCEPLIHAKIARVHGVKHIDDIPYGRGFTAAADEWRTLLAGLDALRSEKNMAVILVAHDQIKRYDSPTTEPFDRFTLKLHQKAVGIIEEWTDIIGFAQYKTFITKEDVGFNKKITRAIGTGERTLFTEARPAFLAGNRFGLPPELPLNYAAFSEALSRLTQPTEPPF